MSLQCTCWPTGQLHPSSVEHLITLQFTTSLLRTLLQERRGERGGHRESVGMRKKEGGGGKGGKGRHGKISAGRGSLGGERRAPDSKKALCPPAWPRARHLSGLRWCTISNPEQRKCEAMAEAFAKVVSPAITCVKSPNVEACVQSLQWLLGHT
ncbi:hypothetical protein CRUP_037703 [Coryphaenoides rupestris]|nr:hypothetical protein CRUP_037703 [Coryphaenoides rupestris]